MQTDNLIFRTNIKENIMSACFLLFPWNSKLIFSHVWSLECQAPLVRDLPESSFSATSAYNDSFKESNVRFTTKEPWCPAAQHGILSHYLDEHVTVDLGCPRSVCLVNGSDLDLQNYSGEYSNDNVTWEKLKTDDETNYYPYLGVSDKELIVCRSLHVEHELETRADYSKDGQRFLNTRVHFRPDNNSFWDVSIEWRGGTVV